MKAKNKPVDPPVGLKWAIYRGFYPGRPYELALVPEKAEVDDFGMYHQGKTPRHSQYTCPFRRESELRQASQGVIRNYERDLSKSDEFQRLKNLVNS